MTSKEKYLDECARLAAILQDRAGVRERFVNQCRAAREQNATQQEIADATGYSRQRISQYLSDGS